MEKINKKTDGKTNKRTNGKTNNCSNPCSCQWRKQSISISRFFIEDLKQESKNLNIIAERLNYFIGVLEKKLNSDL